MPPVQKVECFGLTSLGHVREMNEDQFLVAELHKTLQVRQTSLARQSERLLGGLHGYLLMVADGMGGHAAGELASSIAISTVEKYVLYTMDWFFRLNEQHEEDLLEALQVALHLCQKEIQADVASHPDHFGMGTTVTMAYIIWPKLYVVHAGDSRCYLHRDARLEQVTTDHTMAQKFVDAGELSAKAAEKSRWSHVLWNAVGGKSADLAPEVYKATLLPGDTVVLCSDGLSKHVADEALAAAIQADSTVEQVCRQLVTLAEKAGGSDNITVVVARFGPAAPASVASVADTWAG